MFRAGYAGLSILGDCFSSWDVVTTCYLPIGKKNNYWYIVKVTTWTKALSMNMCTCMSSTFWMWTYSFQLRLRVLIQHITVVFTAWKLDSAIGGICWSKCSAEPTFFSLRESVKMKISWWKYEDENGVFKMCSTACSKDVHHCFTACSEDVHHCMQ